MSVLDRFEKRGGCSQRSIRQVWSKDLQPVDLPAPWSAIDAEAMPVGRDRTVALNEYRFKLSTLTSTVSRYGVARPWPTNWPITLTEYAKSQHYAFVGPVIVIFEEDLDLSKGNFNLTSESVQVNASRSPPMRRPRIARCSR